MGHQNIQDQDLNLVLSSDAKPRLKWTLDLHKRFVDAVTQLGGPEKATPKALMRVMNIHGLTLYHIKSHLQKYRLGKIQQSPACSGNLQEEFADDHRSDITSIDQTDETQNQINESLKIARALYMQMEVQRQLHEQIEVQRHLQLRIEAQGKYLQTVLKKAQDTLAEYKSSAIEVKAAKAELSQLVTMMDNGRSRSLSVVKERENSSSKANLEDNPRSKSSPESSLTSFESSGRGEATGIGNANGRKRSGNTDSTDSDYNCHGKRLQKGCKSKRFDLNSQYVNEFDFDF